MNQRAKCHQIHGCGIFIDAFRSDAFKSKSSPKENSSTFILTHYHSDHYTGLPRGGGAATATTSALHHKIHCTPITASLLREIHGIDSRYIVEHQLGDTWTHYERHNCSAKNDFTSSSCSSCSIASSTINDTAKTNSARITFYDANHCPGAAIVHVVSRNKHYVHTGDFRFHKQKFSTFTEIQKSICQRKIDLLYLDTTYSKPRHDFIPQEEAVQLIASQVKELLGRNSHAVEMKKKNFFQPRKNMNSIVTAPDTSTLGREQNGRGEEKPSQMPQRTLVLLSCYSIGKEKVLWHSAVESNQKIYVNKTKYKMLQCITNHRVDNSDSDSAIGAEIHGDEPPYNDIINKCTTDPKESDLHVIQMGVAGSLFPFFRPNYQSCALYAHQLNKGYQKVVAFLPTGWARGNNSNKSNISNSSPQKNTTVAIKTVSMEELKELLPPRTAQKGCYGNDSSIRVEVRLVPYSEHSSYSELRSCVKYMKPRQIVPTVFSNDKDYRDIEHRFRDLVDSHRAKLNFIRSITGGGDASLVADTKANANRILGRCHYSGVDTSTEEVNDTNNNNEKTGSSTQVKKVNGLPASNNSRHFHLGSHYTPKMSKLSSSTGSEANTTKKRKAITSSSKSSRQKIKVDDSLVETLISMGFDATNSLKSLEIKRNNLEAAIEWLLLQGKM